MSGVIAFPCDQSLANWVKKQRRNLKESKLTEEQVKWLNDIGFKWSMYGNSEQEQSSSDGEQIDDAILI